MAVVVLPFLLIAALALISVGSAPVSHWDRMVAGDAWLECLVSIPIIAIVQFALTMWAVRQAAPTDLRRAGRSPVLSLAASAQWPTRFTAPTIRCPLSRSGMVERSWCALWRGPRSGRGYCGGEVLRQYRRRTRNRDKCVRRYQCR